jgi:hypothetical protein
MNKSQYRGAEELNNLFFCCSQLDLNNVWSWTKRLQMIGLSRNWSQLGTFPICAPFPFEFLAKLVLTECFLG